MLKFKNYHRSEKVPFFVYADFECFIKPMQSCEPNPERSYTEQYQKHEPSRFCYYIKCFDDEVYESKLVSYTGENAEQKIVQMLEEDIREITSIPEKQMIFAKEEKELFYKETKCWICNEKFTNDKVRDHCHFTGRYRGAAHNSCNLKYRKPNFTPAVFHNLSGYDSHLFIKKILVLVREISIVFQTTKTGILALLKKYKLEVIRKKENIKLYTICYVHTQFYLALYMCVFILNSFPCGYF